MNKIIVVQTKTYLQASYLEFDTVVKPLSIDGNKEITYSCETAETSFSRLEQAISETFNLESLDGADISVIVVVCGVESEMVNKLFKHLDTIHQCNMIYVEHVLPYILLGEGYFKKQDDQIVQILDTFYQVKNVGNKVTCSQITKPNKNITTLQADDFVQLYDFDTSSIGADEKLVKQVNDLLEQNKKLTDQNLQYVESIDDLKKRSDNNKSTLRNAKFKGMMEMIEFFKQYKFFDDSFFIPDAASEPEVLQAFLNSGVDIDEKDKNGNTALMLAVRNNNYAKVKLLLENGANIWKKNNNKDTALSLAESLKSNKKILALLKEYGEKH